MKITHIVFDIDGTLVDESESLMAQTGAVAWKFGGSHTERQAVVNAFFAANDRAVLEGGADKNNIPKYMEWIGETLSLPVSEDEVQKLAIDWKEAFSKNFKTPTFFDDSVPCLKTLSAAGYRIIAASGGEGEKKQGLLREAGLMEFFSTVYGASDVGFQKQDVRFWQKLVEYESLIPENVVVIGNQINDDIMHPKSLGMHTVFVKREGVLTKNFGPDNVEAEFNLDSLERLPEILANK